MSICRIKTCVAKRLETSGTVMLKMPNIARIAALNAVKCQILAVNCRGWQ